MGREISRVEIVPYKKIVGMGGPVELGMARDSNNSTKLATNLALYVNKANPVQRLTMEHVACIFTTGNPAGDITHWRQLGIKGECAQREIHLYGPPDDGEPATSTRYTCMNKLRFSPHYEPLAKGADILNTKARKTICHARSILFPFAVLLALFVNLSSLLAHASEVDELAKLPPYKPERMVSGTLRLWGHGSPGTDFMGALVRRWEKGFAQFQPGVKFDYRMYGTASAIGALYTDKGDLAIMGEEIFPYESEAYEKVRHYPIASVEIATGSLDTRNFDFAQMFFVNKKNPISKMNLQELDAIFGTQHLAGAPRNYRVWGDLGLTGEWADKPIHLYGWSFDNDFWFFLSDRIFKGSHRLNNAMHEYAHIKRADGTIYDADLQILQALAKDPYGLAIANQRSANPDVKSLALSVLPGGPYYEASKETLIARTYPLTRIIPAAFNRAPGQPIDPLVKEFLRYLLSRQGQTVLFEDGRYNPLNNAADLEQLKKLDQPVNGLIRVWGDDAMQGVLSVWETEFQKRNPDIRFENKLYGTDAGIAGLYTGVADIALMGRDIYPVESMGFAWVKKRRSTGYRIATGSLGIPRKSPALAIIVNKNNPLAKLTLTQLDAIFDYERHAGAAQQAKTWGDLGLTGEWAGKPIHAYARRVDTGTMVYFRKTVMHNSNKWNWDVLTEFVDKPNEDADAKISAAVAGDPDGLGVTNLGYMSASVKPIAVARSADEDAVLPTLKTVGSGAYPLARSVFAYIDQDPDHSIDPLVSLFLKYVLSADGQADIKISGDFGPLPSRIQASEFEKISHLISQ